MGKKKASDKKEKKTQSQLQSQSQFCSNSSLSNDGARDVLSVHLSSSVAAAVTFIVSVLFRQASYYPDDHL